MKLEFSLSDEVELQIASGLDKASPYPTSRIQKGLVLLHNGHDLSEEAVGFGVPIIKRSLQTIFPSEVDLYLHGGSGLTRISARYRLNLEERISRNGNGSINNKLVYAGKNSLAAIIRHIPFLRDLLTNTSTLLRTSLDWQTTYERSDFSTHVVLEYTIDDAAGKVVVELIGGDFLSTSIREVIIMNELGAHHFDQYRDANGRYEIGEQISLWDPVEADEATFIDPRHHISFSLPQVQGAKLYRGRELIEPRLAWSGFGYSFPPNLKSFSYSIAVKKLP